MNKYQKAKEILEKYDYSTKLELSEGIKNNVTSGITVEQFFMMKKTCIELLDKEIPLIPNRQYEVDWGMGNAGECSNCKNLVNYQNNYCDKCGKKLDWGNGE